MTIVRILSEKGINRHIKTWRKQILEKLNHLSGILMSIIIVAKAAAKLGCAKLELMVKDGYKFKNIKNARFKN